MADSEYDIFKTSYVYICCLHVTKSKQIYENSRIDVLPRAEWG